jgi:hypothetical protein
MQTSLEDAVQAHRVLEATDQVVQSFPSDCQPFLIEVLWNEGNVDLVASDMGWAPTYAQGVWRFFRGMLLSNCPELQEMWNGKVGPN